MKRSASAIWSGNLKQGKGSLSTESGALKQIPYAFVNRFENTPGTNPEELIGAAHAGCFSMAFSAFLSNEGFTVQKIETKAQVNLEQINGNWTINAIHLSVSAIVPNISQEKFIEIANTAKAGCPVSRLLNATITIDTKLES
ncbi:MAG: OsmC family protein [Proteobacteria bacterium]|nr:OsmC family protein [Pseudomonadota bacterium]